MFTGKYKYSVHTAHTAHVSEYYRMQKACIHVGIHARISPFSVNFSGE